jgi:pilin isopeptide linkage protein/LPXTG-motif cell wall-anchored protein
MMKMMRRKIKRKLAVSLILCMLASIGLPAVACADEMQSENEQSENEPSGAADSDNSLYEPCQVIIPVSVQTAGTDVPGSFKYQIGITKATDSDAEPPMPDSEELTLKNEETDNFGPITFTAPGTYKYEIFQTAGNNKGVTYDDKKFKITVDIIRSKDRTKAGKLMLRTLEIVGEDESNPGSKAISLLFNNTYEKPIEETTVPETTRGGGGGGGGGGGDDTPKGTDPAPTNPTQATEPATQPGTNPETNPETNPGKEVYPDLPDVPVNPDGTPDIPEGTPIEIYDPSNPDEPVYRGPYSDSIDLPPGTYEIVVLDENGVPLSSGIFTIDEEGVARGALPSTGDTSIPFVLLALLMAGAAAGAVVLVIRIRKMDE